MLRQIRNYRFDPFAAVNSYAVITDEVHAIPGSSPYWVRLHEVPDENYTDPTSGTPVYVRSAAGTVFTEVSSSPGLNEYRVDYNYKTGWVEFNSGNAGEIILVCYRGTGSPVEAELVNALQWFQPATPFFGGDGSDGDVTISANTALSEDPSGSSIALKQYRNLTINSGVTLSLASGVHGMILAVQGRLELRDNATISVNGRGGLGGSPGSPGGAGGYGGGGGGGDSMHGDGSAGGGTTYRFGPAAGAGGAGGIGDGNGDNGTRYPILAERDIYWRSLRNIMMYGAGGGGNAPGGGGGGGAGGGFLIVNCNILSVASGATLQARGINGTGATNYGGGGGGAGGTLVVLANHVIGETPENVETNMCNVSGGTGAVVSSSGNGGNGAAGYKRVIQLYQYNVY